MAKLVFITGASSGIGQALAWRFYQAGYSLALAARRTQEVEKWCDARQIGFERCQLYSVDVANPDNVMSAGQACLEQQGVPDVVVACAGISIGVDTSERTDVEIVARTFAINNTGTVATFHSFLKPMVGRGSGVVVGIASVNGIRGFPGHGANCPSKAAMISYCECLRGELRGTGVKVVTLCPGYIDTPLTQKNAYSMPFLMHSDDFAEKAFRSIEAGESYRVIPWQMGVVAKVLRLMPNWLFDRVFAGRPRKPRSSKD
jgi:short-subunit dehydrogenase